MFYWQAPSTTRLGFGLPAKDPLSAPLLVYHALLEQRFSDLLEVQSDRSLYHIDPRLQRVPLLRTPSYNKKTLLQRDIIAKKIR